MDFRVRIQEIDTSGLFLAPFIYILLATWHCLDKRHENCSATLMINFVWFTAINADGKRLFNSDGKRGGGGRFSAGDVSAHYTPSGPETVKIDGPLSNSIEAQVPIHITDSRLWLDHLFVLSGGHLSLCNVRYHVPYCSGRMARKHKYSTENWYSGKFSEKQPETRMHPNGIAGTVVYLKSHKAKIWSKVRQRDN